MKDALGHGSDERGGKQAAVSSKAAAALKGIHSGQIDKLPDLQRRHFQEIAATLLASAPPGFAAGGFPDKTANDAVKAYSARVSDVADKLATTNPEFNRGKFIEAAYGKGKSGPGYTEMGAASKTNYSLPNKSGAYNPNRYPSGSDGKYPLWSAPGNRTAK
jgi:hypothetical protein